MGYERRAERTEYASRVPATPRPTARARRFASVLSAAAALSACGDGSGGDGAPARTRVLVYSAHGKDLLEEVERDFEASHAAIDVVWQDMGADQVFDRLRGEKAEPQADVWWGAPAFRFAQAADLGLLAEFRPSWHEHAPKGTHDAAWRWAGQFAMPQVVAYHRDLVPEPPKSWAELADPKWKGRVVLRDPSASGGMKGALGAVFAHSAQATGSDAAATLWFRGVAANVLSVAPNPAKLFDTIRRDTVGVVTIWNLTDVLYQSEVAEPRVPFAWTCPAPGAPTFPDGIALVARPAGPTDAARAFYEFATSAGVSMRLAEKHRRFLVRDDLPKPSWAARIDVTPMDVDWSQVGAHVDAWQKLWEDALSAR